MPIMIITSSDTVVMFGRGPRGCSGRCWSAAGAERYTGSRAPWWKRRRRRQGSWRPLCALQWLPIASFALFGSVDAASAWVPEVSLCRHDGSAVGNEPLGSHGVLAWCRGEQWPFSGYLSLQPGMWCLLSRVYGAFRQGQTFQCSRHVTAISWRGIEVVDHATRHVVKGFDGT